MATERMLLPWCIALALAGVGCYETQSYRVMEPTRIRIRSAEVQVEGVTVNERRLAPGVSERKLHTGKTRDSMLPELTKNGEVLARGPGALQTYLVADLGVRSDVDATLLLPAQASGRLCSGPKVDLLAVDGQIRWRRPVPVSGTHIVSAYFLQDDLPVETGPLAIDLPVVVGGEMVCARVPLLDGRTVFEPRSQWFVGANMLVRSPASTLAQTTYGVELSGGRVLGVVRTGMFGGVGAGLAKAHAFGLVSAGATVGLQVLRRGRMAVMADGGGEILIRVRTAQEMSMAITNAMGGPPRVSAGPRLGISVLYGPPPLSGTSWRPPVDAWGFLLSITREQWVGDSVGGPPLVLSLGFSFSL